MRAKDIRSAPTPSLVVMVAALLLVTTTPQAAEENPPKLQKALDKASRAVEKGNLTRAEESYAKARELAGNPSYDVEEGFSRVQFLRGNYAASLETTRLTLELAETPVQQAISLNRLGALLFETAHNDATDLGESPDRATFSRDDRLDAAAAALRRSLEISEGRFAMPWFNLAEVLYATDQIEEARDAIDKHLSLTPDEFATRRATRLQACLRELVGREDSKEKDRIVRIGDPAEIVRLGGTTKIVRPEKISGPNPQYTAAARRYGVQGVVIIEATITTSGDVVCMKILKGLPLGMTRAVTNAIGEWKFNPAKVNGDLVTVYYNLTVNFRLEHSLSRLGLTDG